MATARNWRWLRATIRADVSRIHGQSGFGHTLKMLLISPGFRCVWSFRVATWMQGARPRFAFAIPYLVVRVARMFQQQKFDVLLATGCDIGPGLYIGHYGRARINGAAKLGSNVNLSHGVTLGSIPRGPRTGAPTIGDRVYVAPGANVSGAVVLGDDVAVGANCVVTRDVPAGSVVVGIPGKVISDQGSAGYIQHPCSTPAS